jgi:hypothetical protein
MIKKIDDHKIEFNYKKKKKRYLAKLVNRDNLSYPTKSSNRVINSIKFNNLGCFQNYFYLKNIKKINDHKIIHHLNVRMFV